MNMIAIVESKDWTQVSIGPDTHHYNEVQDWLRSKWDSGCKIYSWPCMDDSAYGMHFIYRFKDPELALAFKLKFECMS